MPSVFFELIIQILEHNVVSMVNSVLSHLQELPPISQWTLASTQLTLNCQHWSQLIFTN